MMAWRLAYSLETLRDQINAAYPDRSTVSDGTIGDAAHQAVASDHNPNAEGVVCALDITNSPDTGFDAHALADRLLEVRHPDLKYLISNQRIAGDWTGWQWTPYSGTSDPHINHIHISVGIGPDGQSQQPYDDTMPWNVNGEDMITSDDIDELRIAHSEIGGWNFDEVHTGKDDAIFIAAWQGKNWRELIMAQWQDKNAEAFRNNRIKEMAAYDGLVKQVADQSSQIDALKAQLGQQTNTDPNSIIITSKGWQAVWDALKSFFSKNN